MSQVTTPQVPSGSGLSVREGINAVLKALMSTNSGSSAPPNPVAGMAWFDTTAGDIKIRNAANTAWVLLSDMIGALEYDRAQTLTAPQKVQALANLGLNTPALAGQALGIVAAGTVSGGFYIDFRTANGETWRKLSGSLSKGSTSSPDITISYGITFLNTPIPKATNGDASAAADIFVSTFGNTASGFSATARTREGAAYTSGYRVNWETFGRIG